MTTLAEVIDALCEVAETVEMPDDLGHLKAYRYVPDVGDDIDVPCMLNSWQFLSLTRRPNDQREHRYTFRLQLLLKPTEASASLGLQQATAVHAAFLEAFDAKVKLGGVVINSIQNLRGDEGVYMPGVLEWNGKGFVGLQYLMDVTINDVSVFGA